VLQKIVRTTLSLSVLTLVLGLTACPKASASDPRKVWGNLREPCTHCGSTLSKDVYYSDFYGYYRTCWRRWPGGQPPCPLTAPPAEATAELPATTPATTDQNLPELLPTPKPEGDKK
jgi:hypothetical protein